MLYAKVVSVIKDLYSHDEKSTPYIGSEGNLILGLIAPYLVPGSDSHEELCPINQRQEFMEIVSTLFRMRRVNSTTKNFVRKELIDILNDGKNRIESVLPDAKRELKEKVSKCGYITVTLFLSVSFVYGLYDTIKNQMTILMSKSEEE